MISARRVTLALPPCGERHRPAGCVNTAERVSFNVKKSHTTAELRLDLLRKVLLSVCELVSRFVSIKCVMLPNTCRGGSRKKSLHCAFQYYVISEVNQNHLLHS